MELFRILKYPLRRRQRRRTQRISPPLTDSDVSGPYDS